jgi:RNA polymerase sigma factor for flagellar operon FliA
MTKTSQGRDVITQSATNPQTVVAHEALNAWQRYRSERAAEARLQRRARMTADQYLEASLNDRREKVLSHRNDLVEAYLPVLVNVAERLRTKLPSFVEKEELIQAGVPALIQTVERFRPARGNKFETFAVPRLRGAILDALRSADEVPRLARQRIRARGDVVESFRKVNGRPPSHEELTQQLSELKPAERDRVLAEKPIPSKLSTATAVTPGTRSEPRSLGDGLADQRAASPLSQVERADLKRFLIERLDRQERLIIILYYFESMTMLEVAKTLGISESRISQKLKPLLAQIRARIE